jgi:hypothetical protein
MEWEIDGHRANLYGVIYGKNGDYVKLNKTVWEFLYDPSDGYRSYCDGVTALSPEEAKEIGPFFSTPIAVVRVSTYDKNYSDGIELIDVEDGHIWLDAGTDNTDDYYPSYHFDWRPKLPNQEPKNVEKED